ncbi:type III-A CRISPR-associated RAMP protein Csm3 [Candidatus Albibeggiatoa sp. nov. BB20]|uniref:type III-A CRISPR-associated RAMP protein Csm3 n=1 Tax=Candidatus Albibeggiatoa sp. nov. BB20 TaxID=3162723 RepID=UPI003365AAB4
MSNEMTVEELKAQQKAAKTQIHSKIFINGQIIAQTGLHIGGNSVSMAIGGADNVVARDPISNKPYIPGSSLRGKIRSLLERLHGLEDQNSEYGGFSFEKGQAMSGKNPDTLLGKLFGIAADNNSEEKQRVTPTRLLVRDAHLSDESAEKLKNAPNLDMPMTEVKTEVVIDRITSAANPRQFERVPAGVKFNFSLILTLLQQDDVKQQKQFFDLICTGLRLLQEDALGGHGSRGYGQVKFLIEPLTYKEHTHYIEGKDAQPFTGFKIPAELKVPELEQAE